MTDDKVQVNCRIPRALIDALDKYAKDQVGPISELPDFNQEFRRPEIIRQLIAEALHDKGYIGDGKKHGKK